MRVKIDCPCVWPFVELNLIQHVVLQCRILCSGCFDAKCHRCIVGIVEGRIFSVHLSLSDGTVLHTCI